MTECCGNSSSLDNGNTATGLKRIDGELPEEKVVQIKDSNTSSQIPGKERMV